jgi:hypothetical protein
MDKGHSDRPHALCSASSSNRWMQCPGSVGLSLDAPPEEKSIYAEEGTKAHELAEKRLRGDNSLSGDIVMDLHVASYLDFIRDKKQEFNEPPTMRLESKLILNADLNMWGTADVAMTGKVGGKIHGKIIDLKYGKTKVIAKGNSQLAYYAAALLNTSSKQLDEVEVSIFQPRIKNPITSVTYSFEELIAWQGVFTTACNKAMLQMLELNKREYVMGDYCKWCPAKTICPERLKESEGDADEFFK